MTDKHDDLTAMPVPWSVASAIKCTACGAPYVPNLMPSALPIGLHVPRPTCTCGNSSFAGTLNYDSPSPAVYTAGQMREYGRQSYSAGQRAAAVRAAEVCEAQMDLAEAAEADKRAHDALKSSDESRQLSRLKHASVVSLYNAAMRNCADAILREFGIDKEQA